MKKKLAIITAAALMIASVLAGCGNSAGSASSSTVSNAASDVTSSASAAEIVWPTSGTVEIYVPFAAGGNSDLCARIFAQALSEETGKNFIVVNQTEGNGAVCYNTIADAKPDGSVLGWVTPSWFTSYFAGTHDLSPIEEFTTITVTTAMSSQYLIVPKDSPFNTVKDLVDYCTANPGKLVFGMQLGSASHYYAENCARSLGITWNYVETGSGDTPRVTAIMGHTIEATTVSATSAQQYLEAGEVKVLAALYAPGESCPESLKSIPTLKQSGFSDITVKNCNFLYGPKMDDELAAKINETFTKVFLSENVKKQLLDLNQEQTICKDYAEASELINSLYGSYHEVAGQLGVLAPGA